MAKLVSSSIRAKLVGKPYIIWVQQEWMDWANRFTRCFILQCGCCPISISPVSWQALLKKPYPSGQGFSQDFKKRLSKKVILKFLAVQI